MIRTAALIMISIVLCGCAANVRYTPDLMPVASDTTAGSGPEISILGKSSIDEARLDSIVRSYIGVPYRNGGYGKLGVDCSGLVYAVYRDYGDLHLPPNSKNLYNSLPPSDDRNPRIGDLVFFSLDGRYASHVGIYVGDGNFVHASQSRGVMLSDLLDDYYKSTYIGARRVVR